MWPGAGARTRDDQAFAAVRTPFHIRARPPDETACPGANQRSAALRSAVSIRGGSGA